MFKNKIIFLFILSCILSPNYIFSINNNPEISNNFNRITSIDNENEELIEADINSVDYNKYFYFFCLVSENKNNFDSYNKWFKKNENNIDSILKKEFKIIDINNWDIKKQKYFCEKILMLLHDNIFKKYKLDANRLSDIIEYGEYNCVSSSIMYSLFLKKYGFKISGVQTKDHVFIKIIFNNSIEIDVETTNKFGFDPGNKKEILDQFGKTTGFTYVPQKNYFDRFDIDLKNILFLVYNNILEEYYKKNDYIKYANIGYLIYKGRNDQKGNIDFENIFNNYLLALLNQKKSIDAIDDINSYLFIIEKSNKMIDTRFILINNYINDWNDYNQFDEVQNFLVYQNNLFENLKDDERFIKIYLLFIYKITDYLNKNNDFNKSYNLIYQTYKLNDRYKEAELLFNNAIINEIDYYEKNNDVLLITNKLNELKDFYPEFINTIINNEKIFSINYIFKLIQKQKYLDAIEYGGKIIKKYPDDRNIILNLKSAYINYTILLFKNGDINNMIKYCDEALLLFPDDSVIKNNYLSFFMNLINDNINKKDYKMANNILIIAKEKFKNNADLIKKEEYLKTKN